MIRQRSLARRVAVVGIPTSIALMAASVVLWRDSAAPPGCGRGVECFGQTYRPHALASILLGLAAAAVLAATLLASTRIGRDRPLVVGGWRHPVDAIGVRYRDLPYWRRLALAIIAFPLVVGLWVIYRVRRILLGPPAE